MNENTLFIQALKDVFDEEYNADMEAILLMMNTNSVISIIRK